VTTTTTTPQTAQEQAAVAGNASPDQFTNVTWAALVLTLAGDPVTQNNIDNFTTWMTAENGASTWTGTAGKNNPLNNGLGSGGGSGLGSYPDLATAALYAAKGIEGGISGSECGGAPKGVINSALRANAPWAVFQRAVVSSGWAGGCYQGSGFLGLTSASPPPTVSVTQAAAHKSTNGPSIGSVSNAIFNSTSALQNVGASANTLTGGVAGAVGSALGGAAGVEAAASKILTDLGSANWWKRVGIFTLGGALMVGGIILFVSTTKTGQTVESDAAIAAVA
jgi:hypothetical protein